MADTTRKDSPTENRERSWLQFNERVMEEADCEATPILERLKFLSIFTSNLTEFFRVRVGTLGDCEIVDPDFRENKTNMSAREQLDMIFKLVAPLYKRRDKSYEKIAKALGREGFRRLHMKELDEDEKRITEKYFKTRIQPILSPAVIDQKHPFPHIPNGQMTIAAILTEKGKHLFGIIPVPVDAEKLLFFNKESTRYIGVEDVLLHYADTVFNMYGIAEKTIIRVTRNADIVTDDDFADQDIDYRQHMKKLLKKRERLAPVRLETQGQASEWMQKYLSERFQISKEQIFASEAPLDLNYVFGIEGRLSESLRARIAFTPFEPCDSPEFSREPLFKQIARRDLMLSFPFQSMKPLLDLIRQAADDSSVISIKITLYRIAKESKLAKYLIRAAENGKEVFVLMELRARFDEANNINWAQHMEDAGCHVVYGFSGYKVHSKLCLITRRENGKIRYYTHVATGNYNEMTAKLYTDLCLFTGSQEIGEDAAEFFRNMALLNLNGNYRHLLVAPNGLKSTVLSMIDDEIAVASQGKQARIIIKINSLTDKKVIDRLVAASCAGVQVQMIVRGICCIVPGVPGLTENISVVSIVGRFLEHSRIYCFGTDERAKIYIASADFMTRNMDRRVEIAAPILDERCKKRMLTMLYILLSDNVKARDLYADGRYVLRTPGAQPPMNAQMYFARLATENAKLPVSYSAKGGFFSRLLNRFKK